MAFFANTMVYNRCKACISSCAVKVPTGRSVRILGRTQYYRKRVNLILSGDSGVQKGLDGFPNLASRRHGCRFRRTVTQQLGPPALRNGSDGLMDLKTSKGRLLSTEDVGTDEFRTHVVSLVLEHGYRSTAGRRCYSKDSFLPVIPSQRTSKLPWERSHSLSDDIVYCLGASALVDRKDRAQSSEEWHIAQPNRMEK